MNYNYNTEKTAVHIPHILMPAPEIDLTKWAVIACDQYTSQPDYWEKVKRIADNSPSTLNMIFPEVYLDMENKEKRTREINNTMNKYLKEEILVPLEPGFIYVERQTLKSEFRKGLIILIDLEKYDYNKNSTTLIRATEGTILDRLPPRVKIRKNAPVEIPHIMLLFDDPEKTVIEPLSSKTDKLEKLYDFNLMINGTKLKGYRVGDKENISQIINAFKNLADPETFKNKYNADSGENVMLFAAGDGNHSLATAKVCWEKIKKNLPKQELVNHPARYALVEAVNIHDGSLLFEPIHRVLFNVDTQNVLEEMARYFNNETSSVCNVFDTFGNPANDPASHKIEFISKNRSGIIEISNSDYNLEVATLQAFLDKYLEQNSDMKIDYIHGDNILNKLSEKDNNIGFRLPPIRKNDFFKTVILEGALPRKTFSMGEAEEKRFYLECRKIVR